MRAWFRNPMPPLETGRTRKLPKVRLGKCRARDVPCREGSGRGVLMLEWFGRLVLRKLLIGKLFIMRNMRKITLLALIALPLIAGFYGDNSKGVKTYEEGDYQKALDHFRSAQLSKPDSPTIRHNAALTIYRMNDFEKSIAELEKAYEIAADPLEKGDIQYNMGNAWFMQDSLQRSIMHYQKALELNPENTDAKYNLELARALIKEFSEKEQQQQDQQQQQNQQQQEQQQDQQEKQDQEQEQEQDQQNQQDEQQQDQQQEQQQQQREKTEDMTEEEAERLLDALQQDEDDMQKDKMKRQSGGKGEHEKPW